MTDDAEDIISLGGTPEPESKARSPSPATDQVHSIVNSIASEDATIAMLPVSAPSPGVAAKPSINSLSLSTMLEQRTAAATLLAEKVSCASYWSMSTGADLRKCSFATTVGLLRKSVQTL
jgi:hypothetical protein